MEVAPAFRCFIEDEVLPGLDLPADVIWSRLEELIRAFAGRNRALLDRRAWFQEQIDAFVVQDPDRACRPEDQEAFLRSIGYILPEPNAFTISTSGVDEELARLSGPQLVVPADNARYALNAANARWGSLYDSVYGTDVMGCQPPGGPYDHERGARVIDWTRAFLDEIFPLEHGSHKDVTRYAVRARSLVTDAGGLKDPAGFRGYRGPQEAPRAILLYHHGLHVELCIDPETPVGRTDRAGVSDVLLESALSAIIDFEDAVAAVDAADKVAIYRNWLGLMRSSLTAGFEKDGKAHLRRLAGDRHYTARDGSGLTLKGRALLLVRNVGLMMTTPMIRIDGEEIPEGIADAFVTALIGRHDGKGKFSNSRFGSVYVVKPKLHGPEEAAFTRDLFSACEQIAKLAPDTIKIGVMDEERRTSLNLARVLDEVRRRVVFTNTGFLDRTGDEIHTSLRLGPVLRKQDMKQAAWLHAYEKSNVATALRCGFAGRAQIGKGMWTMPDQMQAMLEAKIVHPRSGANTAWVPSPTAATLHALHYHRVDVAQQQTELVGTKTDMVSLLTPPVARTPGWSRQEIIEETEENLQGILGYIVRWIHSGTGCSKVPDLRGVGLMEDRATCRISSQLLANWLCWKIIDESDLDAALLKMAGKVDAQNKGMPGYQPMLGAGKSDPVICAARNLILKGPGTLNGYTEPTLHAARLLHKTRSSDR